MTQRLDRESVQNLLHEICVDVYTELSFSLLEPNMTLVRFQNTVRRHFPPTGMRFRFQRNRSLNRHARPCLATPLRLAPLLYPPQYRQHRSPYDAAPTPFPPGIGAALKLFSHIPCAPHIFGTISPTGSCRRAALFDRTNPIRLTTGLDPHVSGRALHVEHCVWSYVGMLSGKI